MLRVRPGRKPEDWDARMSHLSGRFLPLDPGDEVLLDVLESGFKRGGVEAVEYGPEGPPVEAYGSASLNGRSGKWSKRSEAARKRWADPAYRAKMIAMREEKKKRDEDASAPKTHKVEIGRMDSITLCDDDKAKAINDYARSNKRRSEQMTAFHHDKRTWMESRLSDGVAARWTDNYVEGKLLKKEKRRQAALRRHALKRKVEGIDVEREVTPDGGGA